MVEEQLKRKKEELIEPKRVTRQICDLADVKSLKTFHAARSAITPKQCSTKFHLGMEVLQETNTNN